MVRTMAGTLPWAVTLVVAGGAVWWLLAREMTAGRWLLAALLLGHGLVHLLFAVPASAADAGSEWPFDMGESWLVTGPGLDQSLARSLGMALIGIVVVGFTLAALSTVGVVVPVAWWGPLVAVSAVMSAVVLILFFHPQLVLGLGLDALLVWVAVGRLWVPG
jgi:hypothetical protein